MKRTLYTLSILISGILCSYSAMAQTVMEIDSFRNEFNSLSGNLRTLIINDPGCSGCMYMVQQEMEVFEDPASCGMNDGISYMFIWTKVLGPTNMAHATDHTVTWSEPRYVHYWDEFQLLGDLYLNTLNLIDPSGTGDYTAWHTILCYEPGVVWDANDENPPMPTYWQHKLSEQYNADQNLYFHQADFLQDYSALACLTSISEDRSDAIINIENSIIGNKLSFKYENVEANSVLMIVAADGRTVTSYPITQRNGDLTVAPEFSSVLSFYSLVSSVNVICTGKFVLTK